MGSCREEANARLLTDVIKVKAHQSVTALEADGPSEALSLCKGNDAADRHAKAALKLHPQPSADQARELKKLAWHATIACRVIAATLPLWPKLERSCDRAGPAHPRGIAKEAPARTARHDWQHGRGRMHCSKCLLATKARRPTLKRLREPCPGRANCLCEKNKDLWHELVETTCGGTPLFLCTLCGAYMEHRPLALGTKCKGRRGEGGTNAINRVFTDGLHPTAEARLDQDPVPYRYNADKHGPSRHTVAVRKLTRKRVAKIQPWPELEVEPPCTPPDLPDATEHSAPMPTAEEEAAAFFASEAFWNHTEEDPVGWNTADQEDDNPFGDAAGFWEEVPRAVGAASTRDEQPPADSPRASAPATQEAPEVEGQAASSSGLSRRAATFDRQGRAFWNDLNDISLPASHTERLAKSRRINDVEDLFEPDSATDAAVVDTASVTAAQPPADRKRTSFDADLPARNARAKAKAIAKRASMEEERSDKRIAAYEAAAELRDNKRPRVLPPPTPSSSSSSPAQARPPAMLSESARIRREAAIDKKLDLTFGKLTERDLHRLRTRAQQFAGMKGTDITGDNQATTAGSCASGGDSATPEAGDRPPRLLKRHGSLDRASEPPTSKLRCKADSDDAPSGTSPDIDDDERTTANVDSKLDAFSEVDHLETSPSLGVPRPQGGSPGESPPGGIEPKPSGTKRPVVSDDTAPVKSRCYDSTRSGGADASGTPDGTSRYQCNSNGDDGAGSLGTSSIADPTAENSIDAEGEVIREPPENPGLRAGPAARRNCQGKLHQVALNLAGDRRSDATASWGQGEQMLPVNRWSGGTSTPSDDEFHPIVGVALGNIASNSSNSNVTNIGVENDSTDRNESRHSSGGASSGHVLQPLDIGELHLGDSWEQLFRTYLERQGTQQGVDVVRPVSPTTAAPPPPADVDEEALRELLDLHSDGLPVSWPRGFDAITAKAYLEEFDKL